MLEEKPSNVTSHLKKNLIYSICKNAILYSPFTKAA